MKVCIAILVVAALIVAGLLWAGSVLDKAMRDQSDEP